MPEPDLRLAPSLTARHDELALTIAHLSVVVADAEREEKKAEEAWHAARSHTWQEQQKLDEVIDQFAKLRARIAKEQQR